MIPHDDAAKTILLLLVVVDSCAGMHLYKDRLNSDEQNSSNSNVDEPSAFRSAETLFLSPSEHNSSKKRFATGRSSIITGETRSKSERKMLVKDQLLLPETNVFPNIPIKGNAKELLATDNNSGAFSQGSSYGHSFGTKEERRLKSTAPSSLDAANANTNSESMETTKPINVELPIMRSGNTDRNKTVVPRQTFIYSNDYLASLRNESYHQLGLRRYYPNSHRVVRLNDLPNVSARGTFGYLKENMPRSWNNSEDLFSGALNSKRPSLFDAILNDEGKSKKEMKKVEFLEESSPITNDQLPTNWRAYAKNITNDITETNVKPCEGKTDQHSDNLQRSNAPSIEFSPLRSDESPVSGNDRIAFSSTMSFGVPHRVEKDHRSPTHPYTRARESCCQPAVDIDTGAGDRDSNKKSLFDEVLAQMASSSAGGTPAALGTETTETAEHSPVPDAEVIPGLVQGDIAVDSTVDEAMLRVGINWDVFPEKRWLNGTVPYVVSPLYLPEEYQMIITAIRTINFLSCVRFVPWDGRARDYIIVQPVPGPSGCWSYVGRRGGQQVVGLQRADAKSKRCFVSVGKPLHELMHVLGVYHEHTRADRDLYVAVLHRNLLPDSEKNFEKLSLVNTSYAFEYDYDSVMHYGEHYFSKDGVSPTLRPLVAGVRIGQRDMLSKKDCLKLNAMYGCTASGHPLREMYTVFCNALTL